MSSGTSTESVGGQEAAAPAAETHAFRPWHLFTVVALLAATVAIVVARPTEVVPMVLLTLTIGAAGFVGLMVYRAIRPLTQHDAHEAPVMVGSRTRAAVEREKTLVLRSIKELEFDRAMGKVSDQDFEEMRRRLRARALRLMKQLNVDAVDLRALIERELQERLGEPVSDDGQDGGGPPARRCARCQTENDQDARFCKSCGTALGEDSSGDRRQETGDRS